MNTGSIIKDKYLYNLIKQYAILSIKYNKKNMSPLQWDKLTNNIAHIIWKKYLLSLNTYNKNGKLYGISIIDKKGNIINRILLNDIL